MNELVLQEHDISKALENNEIILIGICFFLPPIIIGGLVS